MLKIFIGLLTLSIPISSGESWKLPSQYTSLFSSFNFLSQKFHRIYLRGPPKSVASSLVKIDVLKTDILEQFSVVIKDELKQLCSTNNPSILRKTSKKDLINFSWESVHKELQEKTPTLERFSRACVENPSQSFWKRLNLTPWWIFWLEKRVD